MNELKKDLDFILAKVQRDSVSSLQEVGELMKDELRWRIEEDVYDRYEPETYKRRSENPQYGQSISDVNSNTSIILGNDGMIFSYNPKGEHSLHQENEGFTVASGDELIRRIETGQGYDFVDMDARPFFQNFESEMIEGGFVERELVLMLKLKDPELDIVADGEVKRTSEDWGG